MTPEIPISVVRYGCTIYVWLSTTKYNYGCGKLRTNTDRHEWCLIVSVANRASSPWMCDLGITFQFGILGHVWYLIVSIPDLCWVFFCFFYLDIVITMAMVSSLKARRWVRPQTQWRPWHKTLIGCLVPDACQWLGPPWLNLRFSSTLTICEPWALFIVPSYCVNLIILLLCDDTLL